MCVRKVQGVTILYRVTAGSRNQAEGLKKNTVNLRKKKRAHSSTSRRLAASSKCTCSTTIRAGINMQLRRMTILSQTVGGRHFDWLACHDKGEACTVRETKDITFARVFQ